MEPMLHVGDVIISKKTDCSEIIPGDVITYHGNYGSYSGKLITHQVVAEPYEVQGKLYFQTMGIANGYVDPEISEEQIVGKMLFKSDFLSIVYSFFITPYGLITVLVILALLMVSELFSLKNISKQKDESE